MEKKDEKLSSLTLEQMEKVSGGGNPDIQDCISSSGEDGLNCFYGDGLNCFYCGGTQFDGTPCGRSLEQITVRMYRCTNPQCSKFSLNQYPAGQ